MDHIASLVHGSTSDSRGRVAAHVARLAPGRTHRAAAAHRNSETEDWLPGRHSAFCCWVSRTPQAATMNGRMRRWAVDLAKRRRASCFQLNPRATRRWMREPLKGRRCCFELESSCSSPGITDSASFSRRLSSHSRSNSGGAHEHASCTSFAEGTQSDMKERRNERHRNARRSAPRSGGPPREARGRSGRTQTKLSPRSPTSSPFTRGGVSSVPR